MNMQRSPWRIFAVLLLIGLTTAVYWPVQEYDFVSYDDPMYVANNRHVRAGITGEGLLWAFTTMETGHWHPVTWISHMVDYQLFLQNPAGHHWTNVLIHLLNTLLLLGVLQQTTGRFWRSFVVASCFALHPLNVESVAWISERKNVLSTSFWFLTVWCYLYYTAAPGIRRYVPLFLAFLLGLLTKPMLVTLPFTLLLLDLWPLRRLRLDQRVGKSGGNIDEGSLPPGVSLSRLVAEKIPLFILAAFSSVLTIRAAAFVNTIVPVDAVSLQHRLMNAVVAYADYIALMIWPHDLAVLYPYPETLSPVQVGGAILLLIGISAIGILQAQQRPYWIVGWLWYVGTLVPVIGLIQVGSQTIADRYSYVPLIGLFVLIVWGISESCRLLRQRAILLCGLSALVISTMTVSTARHLPTWGNSLTLFGHALEVTERNFLAHNNYGVALMDRKDYQRAAEHFLGSLRIKPDFPEAHVNMGNIMALRGEDDKAAGFFREAIKIKPDYVQAKRHLGDTLMRIGEMNEAIGYYREALIINPDDPALHNNIGVALASVRRVSEGVLHLRKALDLSPEYAGAKRNLDALTGGATRDPRPGGGELHKGKP